MSKAGFFETIVGVVVVAVAVAFLGYSYTITGGDLSRGSYSLNAAFGRIDGIAVGADVKIAGVKVGAVTASALDPQTYQARVTFSLEDGVLVPEDSVAKVASDGLLGGAHIAIEPGASEVTLLAGETIALTQGSVDLLGLAFQAFTDSAASEGGEDASDNSGGGTGDLGDDPLGDF